MIASKPLEVTLCYLPSADSSMLVSYDHNLHSYIMRWSLHILLYRIWPFIKSSVLVQPSVVDLLIK